MRMLTSLCFCITIFISLTTGSKEPNLKDCTRKLRLKSALKAGDYEEPGSDGILRRCDPRGSGHIVDVGCAKNPEGFDQGDRSVAFNGHTHLHNGKWYLCHPDQHSKGFGLKLARTFMCLSTDKSGVGTMIKYAGVTFKCIENSDGTVSVEETVKRL